MRALRAAHARDVAGCLRILGTRPEGLSSEEAARRLARFGPNALPEPASPGVVAIFLRQFANPLVYVLLAAATLSGALGDLEDAVVIGVVLLTDASIGTFQEYGAERSARALRALTVAEAIVVRDAQARAVPSPELVPGDLVVVEAGMKVPADLRLTSTIPVSVDESLLTGESLPTTKDGRLRLPITTPLAERSNVAHAGTVLTRGRATGVVVATGRATELGRLAGTLERGREARAPLQVRMEGFARRIAVLVAACVAALGVVALARGAAFRDVFLLGIALAVAAIPEGLPASLTVALAIGSRRMATRHVLARRLVAVEALGSCTVVAADKTGTLTMNALTVRRLLLPGADDVEVEGTGIDPTDGVIRGEPSSSAPLARLAEACALCNDAALHERDGSWRSHGDAVDVALLALAYKAGIDPRTCAAEWPRVSAIPFDPIFRYAATAHRRDDLRLIVAKGALEAVLPMCTRMAGVAGDAPLEVGALRTRAEGLARDGFRVLAVAARLEEGIGAPPSSGELEPAQITGLVLLGVVAMHDPLRPEARATVEACKQAGIAVAMLTGDHPATALAIARELALAASEEEVVTGAELGAAEARGEAHVDALVQRARVFARVEPLQKLAIVRALVRLGHYVAVTGDGANDAPALRAAHIGVAMGQRGTDLARESAELIVTNDDLASLLAGVEEGRVAYANVRKVTYLLLSCGLAEVLLFVFTTVAGLPTPLVPVHLLWLNLVTNGIQDLALAFEPAEGHELRRPPRPPGEPLFDASMAARTLLTSGIMAAGCFLWFRALLAAGAPLDRARNGVLLLLVLFETVQAGNSRSELGSAFATSPARNPFLLVGSLVALAVHVGAMHQGTLRRALHLEPVDGVVWIETAAIALSLLAGAELQKLAMRARQRKRS